MRTVTVRPWRNPVIDTLGHDARSLYVETFWLPTLGPTAVTLLRHVGLRFDTDPEGFTVELADLSAALGLGQRDGRSAPVMRTLARLVTFDLAATDEADPDAPVYVRAKLPPINARHVRRLPRDLQTAHAEWVADGLTHAIPHPALTPA